MKIEILEVIKHEREVFSEGETRVVPDALGEYFCSCGWARDLDESVPTGKRDTTEVRVVPENVMHGIASTEIGG